ncbi:MAG: hypothetical protein V4644_00635 [Patescibacteria group bacterium]
MKGTVLSTYAAALLITMVGSGAAYLIIDASESLAPEDGYAYVDPLALDIVLGR